MTYMGFVSYDTDDIPGYFRSRRNSSEEKK